MAVLGSVGCLVWYMTSQQLKASTPYKYTIAQVKNSPELQELLGTPISEPWFVRSKRNANMFALNYNVSGPRNHVCTCSKIRLPSGHCAFRDQINNEDCNRSVFGS